MNNPLEDLLKVLKKLEKIEAKEKTPNVCAPLELLEESANIVAKSWSGSWLGYHSTVYYRDFELPPQGAQFSQEWGLMHTTFIDDTRGDWVEYDFDDVCKFISDAAGNPDLSLAENLAKKSLATFEDSREELLSLTHTLLENANDSFLERLKGKIEKLTIVHSTDFVKYLTPRGQFISRDMRAIGQGYKTPPHFSVLADIFAIRQSFRICGDLAKLANQLKSHIAKRKSYENEKQTKGTKIFIGHGRSTIWRDLKDFIQDRLGLAWDEFNRVPVAGITNIERLSQMLDDATIAFLIMTAEDEQAGGKTHARMNVIHEAGLFQGRLGFTRAIILLEDGCEEFSNIEGLGQLRFPKGNIKPIFDEIRKVLEREGIL